MMTELVHWLIGSRDYRVPDQCSDVAARILAASGIDFRHMKKIGGELRFTLPLNDCATLERICDSHGIKYEVTCERGLRSLVRRYRKRIGIPIGVLIFCVTLLASEQFIWEIKVVGNSNVPSEEIIEGLKELGCGVGTYIPSIDFDLLHNEYLLRDDKLAWIAVNVRGTVATVEVRELEFPEITIDESVPHNLVASEEGVISYVEILTGRPVVVEGMLVRRGELLASGIEDMKHGFRLVHARGTVLAQVIRSITVEIPLETSVKMATGQEYYEKYLNFFGIKVKFFENTEKLGAKYDKIERETPVRFWDAVSVPLSIKENVYREYEYVPLYYTEEEAKTEAYRLLREECAKVLEGCELVSREVSSGLVDGIYRIDCKLTVITDIAREAPIYTVGTGTQ